MRPYRDTTGATTVVAMRTRAITLLATVLATVLAAASATTAPAPAATVTASGHAVVLDDGTDDLWVIGPGEDDWDPFPHHRPGVDVVGATVRHGADSVTATLRLVDLRAGHWQDFSLRVRSDRPFRRAIVTVDPAHPGGRDRLLDRAEHRLACPGLHHDVDYAADTVRIVLPRTCAGGPAWVRVALATYLFRTQDTISDNPHDDGPVPSYTRRLEPPGQRGRPSEAAQAGQAP